MFLGGWYLMTSVADAYGPNIIFYGMGVVFVGIFIVAAIIDYIM